MKKGRLSKKEQAFIKKNFGTLDVPALAKSLDRREDSIQRYVDKLPISTQNPGEIEDEAAYNIESREFWPKLTKQFDKEELKLLKSDWAKTVKQFGRDVTHTEEKQIIQSCSLTILMHRCLEEIQETKTKLNNLSKLYEKEMMREERDTNLLMQIDAQMTAVRAATTSLTNQYDKLLRDQQNMQKDLKSTRDQRIDKLEQRKTTFFEWLKWIQDEDNLPAESEEIELRRIAMYKSYLLTGAQLHRYDDGTLDQPILNSETVKLVPSEVEAERKAIEIAGPDYKGDKNVETK